MMLTMLVICMLVIPLALIVVAALAMPWVIKYYDIYWNKVFNK